jgi:hypothetical protein
MTSVDEFLPGVLPLVIGCPIPTAREALVNAAILFCEDSHVVQETLDAFTTEPGEARYELDPPSQQRTARILRVTVDGREIGMYPLAQAPKAQQHRSRPTVAYTAMEDGVLEMVLYPTPDAEYEISVEAALRPNRNATRVNSVLYQEWYEAICHGAVHKIAAIPNQSFSSDAVSGRALMMFLRETSKAKNESYKGKVRASLTVRPRKF